MSGKDMRKKAAKIDYATVAFASLPFMGMISFWQVFDGIIPKMLTQTFGLSNAVTGFVIAIDNIFGLFLLPLFGILSDRCASKLGRRTPFIIAGSILAVIGTPLIAIANNVGSLALLISAIILTLVAICMYRTMTVAIVADITPRPLRMKTDSVKKLVGYAGTGVMLVCISAMVPKTVEGKAAVGGGTKITYRYYLQDAAFAVILTMDEKSADEIGAALQNPVWFSGLGRKSCMPTEWIYQGVFDTLTEAREKADSIARSTEDGLRVRKLPRLEIREGAWPEEGTVESISDIPLSFGLQKAYAPRTVTLIELPPPSEES